MKPLLLLLTLVLACAGTAAAQTPVDIGTLEIGAPVGALRGRLEDCVTDYSRDICDLRPVTFHGVAGKAQVTLLDGKLVSIDMSFARDDFAALLHTVTAELGQPNETGAFEDAGHPAMGYGWTRNPAMTVVMQDHTDSQYYANRARVLLVNTSMQRRADEEDEDW